MPAQLLQTVFCLLICFVIILLKYEHDVLGEKNSSEHLFVSNVVVRCEVRRKFFCLSVSVWTVNFGSTSQFLPRLDSTGWLRELELGICFSQGDLGSDKTPAGKALANSFF